MVLFYSVMHDDRRNSSRLIFFMTVILGAAACWLDFFSIESYLYEKDCAHKLFTLRRARL